MLSVHLMEHGVQPHQARREWFICRGSITPEAVIQCGPKEVARLRFMRRFFEKVEQAADLGELCFLVEKIIVINHDNREAGRLFEKLVDMVSPEGHANQRWEMVAVL